jgi:RNA polymerase sigma-70 factor (ECF subfamily)
VALSPGEPDSLPALMAAYQQGGVESFNRVYAVLAPPLRRYLISRTRDVSRADDLLQETFLRIHRARHTYDPRLPVEPWAYAIARHVFLMDRRRTMRAREVPLPEPTSPAFPNVPAPDTSPVMRHELDRALDTLNPARRDAVVLHHQWGFSFDEIAGRFAISAGAARLRASRGIQTLRALLRRRKGE